MALDDVLDDGQADPAAFVFIMAVQALKNLEQFVGKSFIKPRTVVFNVVDGFVSFGASADFDNGGLFVSGELDGIGEQIDHDLLDQGGIAEDRGQFTDI
jgi:hypothetical protein